MNVKGNYLITRALLPKRSDNASRIGSAARAVSINDPRLMVGQSAYIASKTALVKLLEVVAAEHPEVFVAAFHPGSGAYLPCQTHDLSLPFFLYENFPSLSSLHVSALLYPTDYTQQAQTLTPQQKVHTAILRRASFSSPTTTNAQNLPLEPIHLSTLELAGNFAVWLCSPEARFLRGRFVWANWDVDELKAMESRFRGDAGYLTANILGWPFGVEGVMRKEGRVDSVGVGDEMAVGEWSVGSE